MDHAVGPVEVVKDGPGCLDNAAGLRMSVEGFEESSDVSMWDIEESEDFESFLKEYLILHMQYLLAHEFVLC